MAAPDFIAAASANGGGTSATVAIPTSGPGGSVVNGQRALLVATIQGSSDFSTHPTGWTVLPNFTTGWGDEGTSPLPATNSTARTRVWTAVIGSDPAVDPGDTVTLTIDSSSRWTLAVYVAGESAVDSSAINGPATMSASAPFNWTTPSTSASDEARAVHIYGTCTHETHTQNPVFPSWTANVSTTKRIDDRTVGTGSVRNTSLMIADHVASPGSIAGRTAEASQRMQSHGVTVALTADIDRPVTTASTPTPTVAVGANGVQLNSSASGGAGAPFTWAWRFVSGPVAISLSSTTTQNPTTTTAMTQPGDYVFGLVATDNASVDSLEAFVTVTAVAAGNTAVMVEILEATGWETEPGAATLIGVLGDQNNATYAFHGSATTTRVIEGRMGPMNQSSPGDVVALTYNTSMFEALAGVTQLIVKDGDGNVVVAFDPDEWDTQDSIQVFDHQLTGEHFENIPDWTNWRVRIEGIVTV